jgi:hypothetical protein
MDSLSERRNKKNHHRAIDRVDVEAPESRRTLRGAGFSIARLVGICTSKEVEHVRFE